MIKTILKRGIGLVRSALDRPKHGRFLFWFLPIGGQQQDGVMVRFDKRRAGEGRECIAKVRVAMVERVTRSCTAIDMLIEFR